MISITQTLFQIKSWEFIGREQKHFIITSPLTCVTNGFQDFVKKPVSKVRCTSTFDPTACHLVDYNQQQHQVLKSRVLGTQDAFTKYQISMHHQLYQHMKRKNNFLLNRIYTIMALSESKIIRLYINLLPCFLTLFDILHFLHNSMVVVIMASKEYFCEVRSCNQKCFCNLRK